MASSRDCSVAPPTILVEARSNPGAHTPMSTNAFRTHDRVHVGMASMPSRTHSLQLTLDSLYRQVDHIHLYLNEFDEVPSFLARPKIHVTRSQDALGDLGDAGKFLMADQVQGYFLACDDDLAYPPDYASALIEKSRLYKDCIVGVHGMVCRAKHIESFYRSINKSIKTYTYVRAKPYDSAVHMLGTGTIGFEPARVPISIEDFPVHQKNMADIHLGIACNTRGIVQVCVERPSDWITGGLKGSQTDSLHIELERDDRVQTRLINAVEWEPIRRKSARLLYRLVVAPRRRNGGLLGLTHFAFRHVVKGRP